MPTANQKNSLDQLENTLDLYFHKKAPALPQNVKEILVTIAPYLAIISVIFAVPGVLIVLGLDGLITVLAPFGGAEAIAAVPNLWLSTLFLIPVIILEALAIPGLFARKAIAWKYMYWAQLITIIAELVKFNIVGLLIGAIIGFYILFQIRNLYK